MTKFKERSDYFEVIAIEHNIIAHKRSIPGGGQRKSFHRINDEEEFNAACENWAHFPCVVHFGYGLTFKQLDTGKPREATLNTLEFYDRATDTSAEAIQLAYASAEKIMKQFVSYLIRDVDEYGHCGFMFLFDVNLSTATRLGVTNGNLYGWQLQFTDEAVSKDLVYNGTLWTPSRLLNETGHPLFNEDNETNILPEQRPE